MPLLFLLLPGTALTADLPPIEAGHLQARSLPGGRCVLLAQQVEHIYLHGLEVLASEDGRSWERLGRLDGEPGDWVVVDEHTAIVRTQWVIAGTHPLVSRLDREGITPLQGLEPRQAFSFTREFRVRDARHVALRTDEGWFVSTDGAPFVQAEDAPDWQPPSFEIAPVCCVAVSDEGFEVRWLRDGAWAPAGRVERRLPTGWEVERVRELDPGTRCPA